MFLIVILKINSTKLNKCGGKKKYDLALHCLKKKTKGVGRAKPAQHTNNIRISIYHIQHRQYSVHLRNCFVMSHDSSWMLQLHTYKRIAKGALRPG